MFVLDSVCPCAIIASGHPSSGVSIETIVTDAMSILKIDNGFETASVATNTTQVISLAVVMMADRFRLTFDLSRTDQVD